METDEISERYITPCFVNDLEACDGEVNLEFNENLISNEFAVKLCLDYEVKKGKKLVKKELIVALKGELYFVKFIINHEEDNFESGVILERSFLRLGHGVVNFGNGMIIIYPEPDPFEDDSEKTGKGSDDWDQLLDFNFDDTILISWGYLTQEKAEKEALGIRISQKYALFEEERHTTKEEEEAVKRIKGEALKQKDDLGAFIFPIRLEGKVNKNELADIRSDNNTMPYRIYETLGREEMKKIDRGITMINHTQAEAMRKLSDVLCQVGVTTIIAKFLIMDIPIDRDAPIVVGRVFLHTMGSILNTPERLFSTFEGVCLQNFRTARFDVLRTSESDNDDEEEYVIKRNKFRAPIYGPKPAPYLNCTNLEDQSSAIQIVTNLFRKISVWKKAISFHGSLLVPLKQVNWKPNYKGLYSKEEKATGQWRTEIRLTDPYGNIYLQDSQQRRRTKNYQIPQTLGTHDGEARSSRSKRPRQYKIVEEDVLNQMGFDGEIDDMLRIRSKKIIKFRLGGRAHSLTLLEFDRRLGLYQAVELEEDSFNVYFEGGLRIDDNFNAQDYWLSISREDNLGLSRSHTSAISNPILRVIHKMITYGLCQRTTAWVIARWIKRKGAGTQKESQICCGQFILKLARNCMVLTKDVVRSLSASVYFRNLDSTTLRDLIDSEGKLILEDPQMGRKEIRQYAIDGMEYRQSYHWDMYHEVFEHMAGVYSVLLIKEEKARDELTRRKKI
uniref:Uncharacterized protein n=1 Tax=Tanacetum cinerariifolium TaxID=118510 RepID=A0A6L2NXB2_TANCI|nr:hypothetical protein [Tanacetum cinerariifolium]